MPPESRRRAAWYLTPPTLVAAIVGAWSITVPSLWRDESVSAHFARIPVGAAWAIWADVDAVHATYDLLIRPFIGIEPIELGVRLLSVVGFVVATAGLVLVGKRLSGWTTGALAGFVYAALPVTSRYAQEGRSYAVVSAVAVFATLALLRAVDRPVLQRFAVYAGLVTLLGYLHLYAVLLVVAHLLHVAITSRRLLRPTLLALTAAAALLLPLAVIAAGQRERQLFWLTSPGLKALPELAHTIAGTAAATVLISLLVLAGAWALRGRPIAVLWATAPVAVSFLVSQVYPVFAERYVLYVVPAVALLAGAGIDGIARAVRHRSVATIARTLAVALVAVLAFPAQLDIREPDSRPDDLRSLSRDLSAGMRPGDGVMPVPARFLKFVNAYSEPFELLEPVVVGHVPAETTRVWMISRRQPSRTFELMRFESEFERATVRSYGFTYMSLWVRHAPRR